MSYLKNKVEHRENWAKKNKESNLYWERVLEKASEYYKKHKVIYYYDTVDQFGTITKCAWNFRPNKFIEYFDKDGMSFCSTINT